jgi:capsular exopolysaccharide synthesis family protein
MTTLPQTTAIRLPRQAGPMQLAPAGGGLPSMGGAGSTAGAMTGSDVLRIVRNNVWLILFMLVFSGGAGYGVHVLLAQKFPRFTATGFIQVTPTTVDPLHPRDQNQDTGILAVEQKTQAAYLKSETLLTKVLQSQSNEIRSTAWFKKFNGNLAAAKEDFVKNYQVTPVNETRLVRVEFTNSVPKDCYIIVREMVTQHILDESDRIVVQGQLRSQSLIALRTKYRAQYQDIEARLSHLRTQVNAIGGSALTKVNQKEGELEQLRKEESTLDLNLKSSQSQLEQVQKALSTGQDPPLVEQQITNDTMVQQAKIQERNAKAQFEAYRDRLDEKHPEVLRLKKIWERARQEHDEIEAEQRTKARTMVLEQLTQNVNGYKSSLEQIKQRIASTIEDLGEVTNQMVAYFTAESQQKGNADLLKQVQDQLDVLESENSQKLAGKVQWAVYPEMPTSRSFPQLEWSLGISFAAGLLLALTIAFLREVTDNSVRSPRDIQRVGQMTLLGMIGDETQDPQAAGARLPLVIFDAPHSMTAEQLRQVRTRLQHAASLDTTRSLLVTSPSPGDGKTTICCNLAAGLALNGRRILLVDGNFRRPEIHKVFALANDQGFSDVLNGAVSFDEVVQETQVPNLAVMTSGPKPINATEMFESQLLIDFIERALEEFDHVIFDSGPMMVVSESAAMAPKVDGVVTVVRARSNSRGLLTRMRDSLRALKAEHLGVVLNGVRSTGGGYYASNIKTYYEYQNV